ncbi:stAR-related lipid transfer protein 7, mitochondrial [Bacillus rossius redtenbacheri]|uniref:stAR-related lipid transfer protein 7, mitochondrial n=1 Tax=Bacillus rossius redtenbacheri TaxID=93214 RepID=UPI002FDDD361
MYRHVLKVFCSDRNTALHQIRYKCVPKYTSYSKYSFNIRTFQPFITHVNSNIFSNGSNFFTCTFVKLIIEGFHRVPQCLKAHSRCIVKVCTRQCEYVIAHRIKRGHQMFCLYTKLWDEVALRCLIANLKRQLARRGKQVLLGAVGVTAYNWEEERISDKVIFSHLNELQSVHELLQRTVTCSLCHQRLVVDVRSPNISYCECSSKRACCRESKLGWIPFIEREDLLIWRKLYDGLYAYKLYGNYGDVTAEDFLHVQIDAEYRKQWDNTALQLQVLESDPETNSDIVYWEMQWPRMFSNRDYVFNRRYVVDRNRNMIVIVNQATQHPQFPEKPHNFRVKEYWSYMVIKACSSFSEPGIEFSLTYFDNAGITIPSSVTTWVAISGLPDFMGRLRQAARDFHALRRANPKYITVLQRRHGSEDEPSAPDRAETPRNPVTSSLAASDPAPDKSGTYFYELHGSRMFF